MEMERDIYLELSREIFKFLSGERERERRECGLLRITVAESFFVSFNSSSKLGRLALCFAFHDFRNITIGDKQITLPIERTPFFAARKIPRSSEVRARCGAYISRELKRLRYTIERKGYIYIYPMV